jgi:ParB family transcriptional regulator, chromosome partitioning protein
MKIAIDEIVIGNRMRAVGDVTELASSINEIGLLNPITITKDNRLVAGAHRIAVKAELVSEA